MRTILFAAILCAFMAATAFPQAGPGKSAPKKKKKAKPDTTRVEDVKPDSARAPQPAPAKPPEKEASKPPPARREPPPNRPGFNNFVPRAVLCAAVEKREPVGRLDSVITEVDTVCFFTELAGLGGTTVMHRWKFDGEVQAEVPIMVGGPHWRAYSRKIMFPELTGEWTVEVVDEDTRVLVRKEFVYRPAGIAPDPEPR